MGIGHPGDKNRVANYVLSDFAKSDQNWLKDLIYGTSDGAVYLANDDPGKFMNAVAMKTVPQREKPKKINKVTIKKEDISETDNRSAIQKLIDKFSN
jgi:PTH1 family peptidyl-tRNA hydrolase